MRRSLRGSQDDGALERPCVTCGNFPCDPAAVDIDRTRTPSQHVRRNRPLRQGFAGDDDRLEHHFQRRARPVPLLRRLRSRGCPLHARSSVFGSVDPRSGVVVGIRSCPRFTGPVLVRMLPRRRPTLAGSSPAPRLFGFDHVERLWEARAVQPRERPVSRTRRLQRRRPAGGNAGASEGEQMPTRTEHP